MLEYKYEAEDGGEPVECQCCGAIAPVYRFRAPPGAVHVGDTWQCELCSSTHAGNAMHYPRQYENADVLKTICHVGNVILDAVTGRKPPTP